MSVKHSLVLALISIVWLCFTHAHILGRFSDIKPSTSEGEQLEAVKGILHRMFPNRTNEFVLEVNSASFALENNMDAFEYVSQPDGKINVKGTSGVALAAGVYHFLKYSCNVHVSWTGDQLYLPQPLPIVSDNIRNDFHDRFRYYLNVCTDSYSMVFWDWARWEKEIDLMALNGINLPLAANTGLEAIWKIVYSELGLTEQEIDEHFTGPAFLAWHRMGNLNGFGGPLPKGWHDQQIELQKKKLKRMRSFGMTPILSAFSGYAPKALVERLYPLSSYTKMRGWQGFGGKYSTVLLSATDPMYKVVGKMFLMTQAKVYGTDHIYSVDVFNEMPPPSIKPEFMYNTSHAIFDTLQAGDPEAVWVLQGWTFIGSYWNETLVEAWLTAVPYGKLIVLDLASELRPVYNRTHAYYGHPFIWNMIENFGGATRLFGKTLQMVQDLTYARDSFRDVLVGTGMTPEGLNQNDVTFHLMAETMWRPEEIDPLAFSQSYIQQRYGNASLNYSMKYAWTLLVNSVYNAPAPYINKGGSLGRVPVTRPRLSDNLHTAMWYKPADIVEAWTHMIRGAKTMKMINTLRHDLVKVGTQVLEDLSLGMYYNLVKAYKNGSADNVLKYGNQLVQLLLDMDMLLLTNPYSLLGNWIESAKSMSDVPSEMRLLEYNARNQITLWGFAGNIHDYANKNWAGLVESYYAVRWRMFAMELWDCLDKGRDYKEGVFDAKLLKFEQAWCNDTTTFTTQPQGDIMLMSKYLNSKYTKYFHGNRESIEKGWERVREYSSEYYAYPKNLFENADSIP